MKAWAFGVAGVLAASDAAHASGMPQLAFGNPLLTAQVVWGAIIFALFYVGVSKYGLPRVDAILEHRAGVIGADLEQARLSKQRADQAVAELTEARHRAYAQSQAEVSAATLAAKNEAARQAEEANARLDRQLAESEAQIGAARARALGSLQELASGTAEALFARLTHHAADAGEIDGAVAQGLRARGLETA
jgi:F-type H+-transporting ATPase subunit b